MSWTEIWYGDQPASRVARLVLWPLSVLYAAGWNTYQTLYHLRLRRAKHPFSPILCVGNLTVGGSGKTPTVVFVADELARLAVGVVISCSGYGSPHSEEASWAPDGALDAAVWGDEAALFRELRPEIPLIVGRNRVRAAELMAERQLARTVLLLDDGFQHLPLAKDAAVLLDPETNNSMCLPAGPYREPRTHLGRADLVVGPRGSFRLVPYLSGFSLLAGDADRATFDGPVSAFCAIGRPESFFQSLERQGLTVLNRGTRPDHHPLTDVDLFAGMTRPIIVTAKDAVKLRARPDAASLDVWVAGYAVTIEPRDEFRDWLGAQVELWFAEGARE